MPWFNDGEYGVQTVFRVVRTLHFDSESVSCPVYHPVGRCLHRAGLGPGGKDAANGGQLQNHLGPWCKVHGEGNRPHTRAEEVENEQNLGL